MNIFYSKIMSWEEDFFKNDIFNTKLFDCEIEFILFDNNTNIEQFKIYCNMNNVLVINHITGFSKAKNIVKIIKPIIIFHLSDEEGKQSKWLSLAKQTKLFFYQYNHTTYPSYKNNYQIPLGYVKDFLCSQSSFDIKVPKISKRIYTCSFIGEMKWDREEMCDLFEKSFDNTKIVRTITNWRDPLKQQIIPKDMYNIYSNSIFVINSRGDISLNCFRLYESIVSGAIPVIVGNIDEINNTFCYNNYSPKFVIANNWDEAVILCKNLLKNNTELQQIQDYNNKWWIYQISNIQDMIKSIII